eukprot:353472-Chlamydomonas_euryale.AAC.4
MVCPPCFCSVTSCSATVAGTGRGVPSSTPALASAANAADASRRARPTSAHRCGGWEWLWALRAAVAAHALGGSSSTGSGGIGQRRQQQQQQRQQRLVTAAASGSNRQRRHRKQRRNQAAAGGSSSARQCQHHAAAAAAAAAQATAASSSQCKHAHRLAAGASGTSAGRGQQH